LRKRRLLEVRRRRRHVVDNLRNLLMRRVRRGRIGSRSDMDALRRRLRGIGRWGRWLGTVLFHVGVRRLLRVLLLRVMRLLGMLRVLLWMRLLRMLETIWAGLLHHGSLRRCGRRVNRRRWHVRDSGMGSLVRARLRHSRGTRGHATDIISRAGTGEIAGLWGVASLLGVLSRVEHTVTDRRRGSVVSHMSRSELWSMSEVWVHHGLHAVVDWYRLASRGCRIDFFIIVVVVTAREVAGTLVFLRRAMVLVSADEVAHIGGGVLVKLLVCAKDEDCDVDGTQDGKLVCLLEETALSLQKRD
jgi:hypothetical protein